MLRIQRCDACQRHFFYPRRFCRYCHSTDVRWTTVSGRARLDSYTINHRPVPGTETLSPVIAIVQLEEGPRMLTNIVGVEPDPANLALGHAPVRRLRAPRGHVGPGVPACGGHVPGGVAMTSMHGGDIAVIGAARPTNWVSCRTS